MLWSALLVKSTLMVLPARGGDTLKGSLGGRQRGKAGHRCAREKSVYGLTMSVANSLCYEQLMTLKELPVRILSSLPRL